MSSDQDSRTDPFGPDEPPRPGDRRHVLDHETVERDGGPDACAIFPAGASDAELATSWIVAQEASFDDLEAMC